MMILSNQDYAEISEKLDEIWKDANNGILGNARAKLIDIKCLVQQAKDVLLNAIIENGPDAA